MLVWLTLSFYEFCGFRAVAVNSVYKLQFFTFIFAVLLLVLSRLLIMYINTTFFDFSRWRPSAILDFKTSKFQLLVRVGRPICIIVPHVVLTGQTVDEIWPF